MKFKFNRNIGGKVVTYILVGSVAACAIPKISMTNEEGKRYLVRNYYYSEDVKKNKEKMIKEIEAGGKVKVKGKEKGGNNS